MTTDNNVLSKNEDILREFFREKAKEAKERSIIPDDILPIVKHPDAHIILEQTETKVPVEIAELSKKVEECSKITEGILSTFSKVDKDIKELNEEFQKASSGLRHFGGDLIDSGFSAADKAFKKNDDTAAVVAGGAVLVGAALGIIGGAASIIGDWFAAQKEKKAIRRRDIKMQEILELKQKIASERYEAISNFKDSFVQNISTTEKLYNLEFNKSVDINDDLVSNKITLFKTSFALNVKSHFLDNTLDFVLAEMNAWKQGSHDSGKKKPDFQHLMEREISAWVPLLKFSEWDTMIRSFINNKTSSYPVAIATIFTEPALLSNYVGINLPCNNCPSAIIQTTEEGTIDIDNDNTATLLEKNKYFSDCQEILKNNFRIISLKKVPVIYDVIVIAIPIILSFGIVITICSLFPEIVVRFLSLCIAGGICYLATFIELPTQKAYREYTSELTLMKRTISSDEDKSYLQSQTLYF